jgi:hypothetical protein
LERSHESRFPTREWREEEAISPIFNIGDDPSHVPGHLLHWPIFLFIQILLRGPVAALQVQDEPIWFLKVSPSHPEVHTPDSRGVTIVQDCQRGGVLVKVRLPRTGLAASLFEADCCLEVKAFAETLFLIGIDAFSSTSGDILESEHVGQC